MEIIFAQEEKITYIRIRKERQNMMMETGFKLPRDKGMIRFGDVLTSSMTHNVVVMYHEGQKKPIVKVINEDIWFDLEEFVNSWGTRLEISHNVNCYGV